MRISIELLDKVDPSERIKFLSAVIEDGIALLQISLIVDEIGRQHGWYKVKEIPEDQRLLTGEQFSEMKNVVAIRIQKAANDGSLLNNYNFSHILEVWISAAPESNNLMQQWAKNCVTNHQDLMIFIDGFYLPEVSINPSNPYIRYAIKFDLMRKFIDPYSLQNDVKELIGSPEISIHQDVLRNFCQGLMEYKFLPGIVS